MTSLKKLSLVLFCFLVMDVSAKECEREYTDQHLHMRKCVTDFTPAIEKDEQGNLKNGFYNEDILFENGSVRAHGVYEYKDGLKHGYARAYFKESEIIFREMSYLNGKLQGIFISYNRDGSVNSKTNYIDNFVHGYSVTYYENGKIRSEKYMTATMNSYATSKFWYESGVLKSESKFDDDGRVIWAKYYNEKGEIIE